MLWKRPGFTAVAVLTLGLGIGANTAIFSLVNAVLLKPPPFAEPERLVMVWEEASRIGFPRNSPAPANFVDWKTQTRSFEGMAALMWESVNLTGRGEPQKRGGNAVTADLFPLLGVRPRSAAASRARRSGPARRGSSSSATGCGARTSAATLRSWGARCC